MGSQSEEIVHHAQVPVLVIRGAEDFWPPARIVIGEDFSDDARKAGELVAAIGKLYGAQALLVYSHPDLPEVPPGERRSRVENLTEMRERDESMLEARARELEEILGSRPDTRISAATRPTYSSKPPRKCGPRSWPSAAGAWPD